MNGYEATRSIGIKEVASAICKPIIGVTAHALKGAREKCIDNGIDDLPAQAGFTR